MTSDAIDQMVAAQITPESVVDRMFRAASVFDWMDRAHVKRASHSTCSCTYCSVIRRYVRAKIMVRRLERGVEYERMEGVHRRYPTRDMMAAGDMLAAATVIKNGTPKPTASLIDLLPS